MANSVSIDLPPQYRGRALADLNQLIEQVEDRLQLRCRVAEHLAVAGKEAVRAAQLLQIEEKRGPSALLVQGGGCLGFGPPHEVATTGKLDHRLRLVTSCP
jgi:hypothetical protein